VMESSFELHMPGDKTEAVCRCIIDLQRNDFLKTFFVSFYIIFEHGNLSCLLAGLF